MLDELDLAFEEPERGRGRRGGHRSAHYEEAQYHHEGDYYDGDDDDWRGRGRRGRSFLALGISLIIIAGLAFGAYVGFSKLQGFFIAPDYNSGGSGEEVTVQVASGQSATDIGNTLYAKGVVKSSKAFVEAVKANPQGANIQPGSYKLPLKMRARDALAKMLDGSARQVSKVTIPEGITRFEIFNLLSKATGIPAANFDNAAKNPVALGVPESWFVRKDGQQALRNIEGFLFPATYEFDPEVTAEKMLSAMVAKFLKVADSVGFIAAAESKGLSPNEALVTASLLEQEAGVHEDMPKVARVVYNRLNSKPPMPLQFDSTANYWLAVQGHPKKRSEGLTKDELDDPKNPYNTVSKLGLVPAPIGNPGEIALKSAVNPAQGTWLYFVLIDNQGHSAFASTLAEHENNLELAFKNGVRKI